MTNRDLRSRHEADTSFLSNGIRCAATRWLPPGDGPHPGVVVVHGFACHRRMRLGAFVDALVAAGMAVLTFDPRHLGESGGEPRRLVDPERLVADAHAAVSHLRSEPAIGGVGLLGISLGGGIAMQVAIDDPSVAALAHLVGFTRSGIARTDAETETLLALVQADLATNGRGEPVTIPVCGWPGEPAVIPTHDAMYGFGLLNESGDEVNRTPARSLIGLATFAPADRASELDCPVLYYACEDDVVTPFAATAEAIAMTPAHDTVAYRGSHFDVFAGERRDHAAEVVSAFLGRAVTGDLRLRQDRQLRARPDVELGVAASQLGLDGS